VALLTIDEASNAALGLHSIEGDEASHIGSLRPIQAPDLISAMITQSGRRGGSE